MLHRLVLLLASICFSLSLVAGEVNNDQKKSDDKRFSKTEADTESETTKENSKEGSSKGDANKDNVNNDDESVSDKEESPKSEATNEPNEASDSDEATESNEANTETPQGHSVHGEAFNEGPRQAAGLIGDTGRCSFPVESASEEVQKLINQGVGQLHGFWYLEAERTFRQVAAIDSECAIAYWGMALANANNKDRAKKFVEEAKKRRDKADDRGKKYIDALHKYLTGSGKKEKRGKDYLQALEKIALDHPEDTEALAFIALQLWQNRNNGLPIVSYFALDGVIEQVLQREPLHPVHHYRIHLWDYKKSSKALESAAKCGEAAPAIAHMWHMPGHIYSREKRYGDAVWQQEASARVDHAHMMRTGLLPDQIHNFAHNNEWLIRNLIKVGRAKDAVNLAKNMIDLPRHPKYNTLKKRGSTYYGRLRLFEVLNEFEMWDELVSLADTHYLEPTDELKEQVKRLRYLGRAHFRRGTPEDGIEAMNQLEMKLCGLQEKQLTAGHEALEKAKKDKKSDKDQEKAENAAKKKFANDIRIVEKAIAEMKGHIALQRDDFELATKRFKEAGGAGKSFDSLLLLKSGKEEEAIKKIGELVKSRPKETLPLARQIYTLWKSWKRDEAKAAFEKLRNISGDLDIDAPPFARLAAAAEQLDLPTQWRIEQPPAKDLGWRPPLDDLGPFRWSPTLAPNWTLANSFNKEVSLEQYRGKPVVVIFYLGFGCLHCAEQLQAFAPETEAFREAGISIVAISTDSQEDLQKSIDNYGKPMPFPILANKELDVFKQYRVYDDFEKQPLHGTFLIDASGMVRWCDISYEPFMDHEFVLNETKRLLGDSQKLQVAESK